MQKMGPFLVNHLLQFCITDQNCTSLDCCLVYVVENRNVGGIKSGNHSRQLNVRMYQGQRRAIELNSKQTT